MKYQVLSVYQKCGSVGQNEDKYLIYNLPLIEALFMILTCSLFDFAGNCLYILCSYSCLQLHRVWSSEPAFIYLFWNCFNNHSHSIFRLFPNTDQKAIQHKGEIETLLCHTQSIIIPSSHFKTILGYFLAICIKKLNYVCTSVDPKSYKCMFIACRVAQVASVTV